MKQLKSYAHPPLSGRAPQQLVILLHGLGADGRDLLGLAPYFAKALPDAVFVSPDAPFPCDMAPMGHQWFSLQTWTPESLLAGVKAAAPVLDNFITEQMDRYDIPAAKVALVGFSQGTMMSLYVGPRFPRQLGGIVAYSGALVWDNDTVFDDLNKVPVFLVHGAADNVVPVGAYYLAKELLDKAKIPVAGGVIPGLMHNIDEEGLQGAAEFLQKVLV